MHESLACACPMCVINHSIIRLPFAAAYFIHNTLLLSFLLTENHYSASWNMQGPYHANYVSVLLTGENCCAVLTFLRTSHYCTVMQYLCCVNVAYYIATSPTAPHNRICTGSTGWCHNSVARCFELNPYIIKVSTSLFTFHVHVHLLSLTHCSPVNAWTSV